MSVISPESILMTLQMDINGMHLLAGFEHPVDQVVTDLLECLDNPGLALLQWTDVYSVVEVRFAGLPTQYSA